MTEAFPRPYSIKTPSTALACVVIKERNIKLNSFFIVASASKSERELLPLNQPAHIGLSRHALLGRKTTQLNYAHHAQPFAMHSHDLLAPLVQLLQRLKSCIFIVHVILIARC